MYTSASCALHLTLFSTQTLCRGWEGKKILYTNEQRLILTERWGRIRKTLRQVNTNKEGSDDARGKTALWEEERDWGENSDGRSRQRERNVKLWKERRGSRQRWQSGEGCFCVCAVMSANEAQHFPCGVDECKRVAVGGWKAELW